MDKFMADWRRYLVKLELRIRPGFQPIPLTLGKAPSEEQRLAQVTAGLSAIQIRGLFRQAQQSGLPITYRSVSGRKKASRKPGAVHQPKRPSSWAAARCSAVPSAKTKGSQGWWPRLRKVPSPER